MVIDLVNVHLGDVLLYLQTEGHEQESVPPFVGVDGCEVRALLIQMHTLKAVLAIRLGECGSSAESVRDFIYGWGLVVLSYNCPVEVSRVKANTEDVVRVPGVGDG